ncbi:MAG: hypothetical protein KGZ50_09450 [Peptococcaceae bacterium]|nr:hypothetical protein [Peptococcaceae bacterium]
MPRTTVTYDLLFSCPGDVVDSCLPIIKEAVAAFNKVYGTINNTILTVKHWSTDSYPESGGAPQELLNKQLVQDCDAAVAVFWTRFGSPTEKYGSGTEEEIEEMLSAGKQVFLYFLDKPMEPSRVNSDEYKKVKAFQEKYKDRGIYWLVKNEQELMQQFTNHLGLHFLKRIAEPASAQVAARAPKLSVTGVDGRNELEVRQYYLLKSKFLESKREEIVSKIEKAQEIVLPERSLPDEQDQSKSMNPMYAQITTSIRQIEGLTGVEKARDISPGTKKRIQRFCEENGIAVEESFWNVGNLKASSVLTVPGFVTGPVLEGEDNEKKKYELIGDIEDDVICYEQYRDYFAALESCSIVECIVSNSGTMHDEDVDVRLYIPKGAVLPEFETPMPGGYIIDEINKQELAEGLFCRQATVNVDAYSDYPIDRTIDRPSFSLPSQSNATEELRKSQRIYRDTIERLFCYEVFVDGGYDVLEFNIRYIKQHRCVHFPTVLIFRTIPEFMNYEIRSKNSGEIVKGTLTFKSEEA